MQTRSAKSERNDELTIASRNSEMLWELDGQFWGARRDPTLSSTAMMLRAAEYALSSHFPSWRVRVPMSIRPIGDTAKTSACC